MASLLSFRTFRSFITNSRIYNVLKHSRWSAYKTARRPLFEGVSSYELKSKGRGAARAWQAQPQAPLAPTPRVRRAAVQSASSGLRSHPVAVDGPSLHSYPLSHLPPAQARLVARAGRMGEWGGEAEMSVLAKLYGINIQVLQRVGNRPTRYGEPVEARQLYQVGGGSDRTASVLYSGDHYDSVQDVVPTGEGTYRGRFSPQPGDGNCLFHAIADAAGLPFSQDAARMHAKGKLQTMVEGSPIFRAMFADLGHLTPAQKYAEFKKMVVLQMRHDLKRELSKPEYAEMAEMVALGQG